MVAVYRHRDADYLINLDTFAGQRILIQNDPYRLFLIPSDGKHLQPLLFEHGFALPVLLPNHVEYDHPGRATRSLPANRNP